MAWTRSICRREMRCSRRGSAGALQAAAAWLKTWAQNATARRIAGISNLGVLLWALASQGPNIGPAFSVQALILGLPPEACTVTLIATSALTSLLLLLVSYGRSEPVNSQEQDAATAPAGASAADMNGVLEQMGHDLRTPLNAIIGFSDMMQQQMHGPLGSNRYQDYAGHIRESGAALLVAIESTLTLTQNLAERGASNAAAIKPAGELARNGDWNA